MFDFFLFLVTAILTKDKKFIHLTPFYMITAKLEGIELLHPLISRLKYFLLMCSNDIFSLNIVMHSVF